MKQDIEVKKNNVVERPSDKKAKGNPSVKSFVEESKIELSKVSWQNRAEVVKATSVVLAIVILSSIFVGLIDVVLAKGFYMLKTGGF